VHDAAREQAVVQAIAQIEASGLDRVRIAWCDLHGQTRSKTLTAQAAVRALREGIGMVSTLVLSVTVV
jgi:glutamine synthetase